MIKVYVYCDGTRAGVMKWTWDDDVAKGTSEVHRGMVNELVRGFERDHLRTQPHHGVYILLATLQDEDPQAIYLGHEEARPATNAEIHSLVSVIPTVPPNLDDATEDELRSFREELVKSLKTTQPLIEYTEKKLLTREMRRLGYIQQAQQIEKELDNLYLQLPEHVRW